MRQHRVRCLLMGGQACVLYGGAEFSRDTDFAILASEANLTRLRAALDELDASVIAVPPFNLSHLKNGHAVHFRCQHPEAQGMRVDVMTRMRGVDAFPALWKRRTTMTLDGDLPVEVLSLPDLVRAKKTQRDKDWPMIRRLVEANYFANEAHPTSVQIDFWLRELRTAELLLHLASIHPKRARVAARQRPALKMAVEGDEARLSAALELEEETERTADRQYWLPLRKELERLRHHR